MRLKIHKNSYDKCVTTLIKAKTTLFIFGQYALPIIKEETSMNQIIRWKPIFDHPSPKMPAFSSNLKILLKY
jgi:hypothetical protein